MLVVLPSALLCLRFHLVSLLTRSLSLKVVKKVRGEPLTRREHVLHTYSPNNVSHSRRSEEQSSNLILIPVNGPFSDKDVRHQVS